MSTDTAPTASNTMKTQSGKGMSAAGEFGSPNGMSLASEETARDAETHPDGELLLIQHAQNGDRNAFRTLMLRYSKQAYNTAYRFVGDHDAAKDIVQDAFVKVYAALPTFRSEATFATWLYRIVVNLALRARRREGPADQRRVSVETVKDHLHDTTNENLGEPDRHAHVERALHELPTMQRAVIILRHLNGLSTKQVSRILQCSEGTVKTHLFRGLKNLRRKLAYLQGEG